MASCIQFPVAAKVERGAWGSGAPDTRKHALFASLAGSQGPLFNRPKLHIWRLELESPGWEELTDGLLAR